MGILDTRIAKLEAANNPPPGPFVIFIGDGPTEDQAKLIRAAREAGRNVLCLDEADAGL